MSPADQVLFERWRNERDASAFTRLAENYAAMVHAVGLRITGNTHDAEDVAQAAFETLASQKRAPRVHLGAWLHRVATYRALSHLRGERRRQAREKRYQAERSKQTELGWNDVYDLVDETIAALPDNQRDVVVAHYLEGRTHAHIARELGLSRSAVTQRIHGGVSAIRTALRKRGVAVPLAALGGLLAHGADAAAPATLAAQLGKIALSGYTGKAGAGIGLWQGLVAGLGSAKGLAAGALVVLATVGLGFAVLSPGHRDSDVAMARIKSQPQAEQRGRVAEVDTGNSEQDTAPTALLATAMPAPEAARAVLASSGPGARVFGWVLDTDGHPVAGAQVQLSGSEALHRGTGWVTEDDGTFEFANVVPTETCWVGAFTSREGHLVRGNQAELKPVLPGKSYEVTLTLYDGVIAGRVLDAHTRPMSGIKVLANPAWFYHWSLPAAMTGEDGRYRIAGVMAGEYEMRIEPVEGSYIDTGVKVRSDGIGVRNEVNLVYKTPEGSVLHGGVANASGEPIEGAYVHINLTVAPHTSAWSLSGVDGQYEIRGIPQGPNLVNAMHPQYGDRVLRNVALDGAPVDIVLPHRGVVQGQVVRADTGEVIPDFEIHTWEPTSDTQFYTGSEQWKPYADVEGRFSLVLKPGDQPLRVRAKGFGESAQTVPVPAGEVLEEVRVALKPAVAIRGMVVDAVTGKPVAGARIYRGKLPSESSRPTATAVVSDEAGEFVLEDGAPDGALLSASHPAYAPVWKQTAAGETVVTLAMGAGLEVTGSVSVNGSPVEGIAVHAVAPEFSDSSLARASTDAAGHFAMRGLPVTGVLFHTEIEPPNMPQTRSQYFQPDANWRAGSNPINFRFLEGQGGFQVTVLNEGQPQAGLLIRVLQVQGGGFMEMAVGFTGPDGAATFSELPEGRWEIKFLPPGAKGEGDAITLGARAKPGQLHTLQTDLSEPGTVSENVVLLDPVTRPF